MDFDVTDCYGMAACQAVTIVVQAVLFFDAAVYAHILELSSAVQRRRHDRPN